jgi:2'-5' RNA ligase
MAEPVPGDGYLAVLLPGQAAEEVLRWRYLFPGTVSAMGPPHITVVYSPFVPHDAWASIQCAMADCVGKFATFEVTLSQVGVFLGEPSYLWLKPEDGGVLKRIRDILAERFSEYVPPACASDGLGFVPHVTVSVFDSAEELSQARQAASAGLTPVRFAVRDLSYAVLGDDGEWRECGRLVLGRSARA